MLLLFSRFGECLSNAATFFNSIFMNPVTRSTMRKSC
jgi:hypothetical protein